MLHSGDQHELRFAQNPRHLTPWELPSSYHCATEGNCLQFVHGRHGRQDQAKRFKPCPEWRRLGPPRPLLWSRPSALGCSCHIWFIHARLELTTRRRLCLGVWCTNHPPIPPPSISFYHFVYLNTGPKSLHQINIKIALSLRLCS